MKKLWMIAAIAALSSSAWAQTYNVTYTATVSGMGDYIDKDTKQILWGSETGTLPEDLICALVDTTTGKQIDSYVIKAQSDQLVANKPTDTTPSWSIKSTYFTEVEEAIFAQYAGDGIKKLQTVIYSSSRQMEQRAAVAKLGTDGTVIGSTMTFAPAHVPEPTSGMLMLLGFTGLMLKRKKAA